MTRPLFLFLLLLVNVNTSFSQRFFTREGKISFFSKAPLEDIEAHNQTATSVLDAATGKLEFAVLIKGFQFQKALMQEHFNENYLESSKYPKAVFKGQIDHPVPLDISENGTRKVNVSGTMTIHGVVRDLEVEAELIIQQGRITAKTTFPITVADYDIKIPAVVRDNIAKVVTVTVEAVYLPMN